MKNILDHKYLLINISKELFAVVTATKDNIKRNTVNGIKLISKVCKKSFFIVSQYNTDLRICQ